MDNVDRTCEYCKKDKGYLTEIRFYDFDAERGTTERKYPLGNGGLLNKRICCGDEECFKEAMKRRKEELTTS